MNSTVTPTVTSAVTRRLCLALSTLAVAALAACSQSFPPQPLGPEDRAFEQSAGAQPDADTRVALGQLYFTHNLLDQADAVLAPVVEAEPANAQALAWYGANNCKLAGRRGPWLMGLDKLYLVKRCLDQTDKALAMAPQDFVVQMVHMETGREVDMFGSFERAQRTRQAIEKTLAAQPEALPPEALAQFHVAAARIDRKLGNAGAAAQQLERAAVLARTQPVKDSINAERRLLGKV